MQLAVCLVEGRVDGEVDVGRAGVGNDMFPAGDFDGRLLGRLKTRSVLATLLENFLAIVLGWFADLLRDVDLDGV